MKKKCSRCSNNTFYTRVFIKQTWMVDDKNIQIRIVENTDELTKEPTDTELYTCTACDYEAAGLFFNTKE